MNEILPFISIAESYVQKLQHVFLSYIVFIVNFSKNIFSSLLTPVLIVNLVSIRIVMK